MITKAIRFIGSLILFLAGMIKFLSGALKFLILIGFGLGTLMFTFVATFEALHLVQPLENAGQYGMIDVFEKDLWAWVVAVLGWTTMIYGGTKMFETDKAETKKMNNYRESDTWLNEKKF